jgi:D-inositol-3-phosphate glycosyltransferase
MLERTPVHNPDFPAHIRVEKHPRASHSVISPAGDLEVALLTGGKDEHYAFGVATALAVAGVRLDVIGNDELDRPELRAHPGLHFLNLRGDQRPGANSREKVLRVLRYYGRLMRYAATAKPKVFHILWNNRFEFFDRTFLMLYYRLLGKRVVLTAHNVNAGLRDLNDTLLNRLTLRVQYRLAEHIFVHTDKMKDELMSAFGVANAAIVVIPYPVNNAVPETDLSPSEAKQRCGIRPDEKSILFFGEIAPYKGLDLLVRAFLQLPDGCRDYRLIIAGRPKGGSEKCAEYLKAIQDEIRKSQAGSSVTQRIEYIPNEEMELYFKAADVLVLPYRQIFQSGILFLAFGFGLPVVASDVGSFREDVIEGQTGSLCKPGDALELAQAIKRYFESDLYSNLDCSRRKIREYVREKHSWDVVARITRNAYEHGR